MVFSVVRTIACQNGRTILNRRAMQSNQLAQRFKSTEAPRLPFFANIDAKVLYIVGPLYVIGMFTLLPCYTASEVGPADRFNWERPNKRQVN